MGAGIPADGTRSDNSYLPTHAFLPALLAPRLARRPGSSQRLNRVAPGAKLYWLIGPRSSIQQFGLTDQID
jgi:hypothetical protein